MVITKGLEFEFEYAVMNVVVVEGISTERGSHQVWSESELELKSRQSNCRETIQLQLMYVLHPLDPFLVLIYKRSGKGQSKEEYEEGSVEKPSTGRGQD
jgi:hypothetical protein